MSVCYFDYGRKAWKKQVPWVLFCCSVALRLFPNLNAGETLFSTPMDTNEQIHVKPLTWCLISVPNKQYSTSTLHNLFDILCD